MSEPTQEQPAVTPEVTTAPAGSGWSRIPDHLGRARTSTVVLAVLFLAIFALYLNIRPDTTGTSTAGTDGSTPAQTSTPAPAPTPTPTPTPTPETTAEPTPTEEAPTSAPTDTTIPDGTTTSGAPEPTAVTPEPTLPTPTATSPAG
jgi:cytoskeletal protein RodZ